MNDTINHSALSEGALRRGVKVRRLYEVDCVLESCNGNSDEGEIYDNRAEADVMRENHIRMHMEGHFREGVN